MTTTGTDVSTGDASIRNSGSGHASALGLAAVLGTAGLAHFVAPEFFDNIVPSWMPGSARLVTYVSGVVELTAAALVAVPRTRRIGGWVALATFVGVFPANIQGALDGGYDKVEGFGGTALAAWLRLPLQLPLIWWAYRVARRAEHSERRVPSSLRS